MPEVETPISFHDDIRLVFLQPFLLCRFRLLPPVKDKSNIEEIAQVSHPLTLQIGILGERGGMRSLGSRVRSTVAVQQSCLQAAWRFGSLDDRGERGGMRGRCSLTRSSAGAVNRPVINRSTIGQS